MQDEVRIMSIQVLRAGIVGSGVHCSHYPLDGPALLLHLERPLPAGLLAFGGSPFIPNYNVGLATPLATSLPPVHLPSRNSNDRHASELLSEVLSQSEDDAHSSGTGHSNLLRTASGGSLRLSTHISAAHVSPCVYLGDGTLESVGVVQTQSAHAVTLRALAGAEMAGPMGMHRSAYSTPRPSHGSHLAFVTEHSTPSRPPLPRALLADTPNGAPPATLVEQLESSHLESRSRYGKARRFCALPTPAIDASTRESEGARRALVCASLVRNARNSLNSLEELSMASWQHTLGKDDNYESADLSESALTESSATSGAHLSAVESSLDASREFRRAHTGSDVSNTLPMHEPLCIPHMRSSDPSGRWPSRSERKPSPFAMMAMSAPMRKGQAAPAYKSAAALTSRVSAPIPSGYHTTSGYQTTSATCTTNSNASSDLGLLLEPSDLATHYARAEDLMMGIGLQWDRVNVLLVNKVRSPAL